MKNLLLIKLGGSLITDKTRPMTPRPLMISQLAEEIAEIVENHPQFDLIVGTGAGSFGHFLVKANAMSKQGPISTKESAVEDIHLAVERLNKQFTDELSRLGVRVTTLSGQEIIDRSKLIKPSLSGGILSVYGDILARAAQYEVKSTEELFLELINQLADQYQEIMVVFATSVDGVLDRNGRTIANIDRQTAKKLKFDEVLGFDITGGMKQKIGFALDMLAWAQQIRIVDGRTRGNIIKAINQKKVGTQVK